MTGHWREVRKLRFDRRQLLIYAVTDKAWTGKLSLKEQVEEALKGGATMVQLREKELDKGNFEEVLRTAWDIRRITEEYNVPLMIDDNLELALACRADAYMWAKTIWRRLRPEGFWGLTVYWELRQKQWTRPEKPRQQVRIIWAAGPYSAPAQKQMRVP